MRPTGKLLTLLGIFGLLYFLFVFDISVEFKGINGEPERIVNLGKMSDRENFIIASSALLLCGIIILATNKRVPIDPIPVPPAPVPPQGFNQPLHDAFEGRVAGPRSSQSSFVVWRRHVPPGYGFTDKQMRWGYDLGLEPGVQFPQWVAYVEAIKARSHRLDELARRRLWDTILN